MNRLFKISVYLCSNLLNFHSVYGDQTSLNPKDPPLFYWDAKSLLGFSNFGDALSEALVQRILGRTIQIASQPFNGEKKLLGMGSIMSYARDHDVIWGTGVNG